MENNNKRQAYSVPITAIVAMLCITVLQAIALVTGLNGTILSASIASLAGLGGYAIGRYRQSRNP